MLGITDGHCNIPERVGVVHCAFCLTHPSFLLLGAACPNGVTLESLPLERARVVVRKKDCATCPPTLTQ